MPESKTTANENEICRDRLAELLNEVIPDAQVMTRSVVKVTND